MPEEAPAAESDGGKKGLQRARPVASSSSEDATVFPLVKKKKVWGGSLVSPGKF